MSGDRAGVIEHVRRDRWWAHRLFFSHRHSVDSAGFHPEFVEDFWNPRRFSVLLGFRGCGKSTLGEEDLTIAAAEEVFHNCIIIGSSEARAAERLAPIAYELEQNDLLNGVYGEQAKGSSWTQTKIVTRSGVCLQALGRDQDIRGIKHLEFRPDFVFVDDFEDKDTVQTPGGRRSTLRWFLGELLPACTPSCKIRVRATPMDPESVPMELINRSKWHSRVFPIERRDAETGMALPSWPQMFSAEWIEETKRTYLSLGEGQIWSSEFMCEAVSEADRVFKPADIRIVPRLRTWQPVYAFFDPARTVNRQSSATTGWAVWSWLRNRLIVWDAGAEYLLPDEIVGRILEVEDRWHPVELGVETNSLEEFLMQPLRRESSLRGIVLPLKGRRAPVGKHGFIRGLQPFFKAGEVEFATELSELREQLLGFPTGRIDAPNALAYALVMRPGLPVYENFDHDHVLEARPYEFPRHPILALNAAGGIVAAALLAVDGGRTLVLEDWLREGDAASVLDDLLSEAALSADGHVTVVCPPPIFDPWNSTGLVGSLRAVPISPRKGGAVEAGRAWLRDRMERRVRGSTSVQVSTNARHTLNALGGGYAYGLRKGGGIAPEIESGLYKVLMEGIESLVGLMAVGVGDEDEGRNWAYTRNGDRFLSALSQKR